MFLSVVFIYGWFFWYSINMYDGFDYFYFYEGGRGRYD